MGEALEKRTDQHQRNFCHAKFGTKKHPKIAQYTFYQRKNDQDCYKLGVKCLNAKIQHKVGVNFARTSSKFFAFLISCPNWKERGLFWIIIILRYLAKAVRWVKPLEMRRLNTFSLLRRYHQTVMTSIYSDDEKSGYPNRVQSRCHDKK